jgi:hypothetical protein
VWSALDKTYVRINNRSSSWEYNLSIKGHTGLGTEFAGKPGDRNSPAPDIVLEDEREPAEMVDSGITAGGTAGIDDGGKESMGGICDIGIAMFLGMTGELACDDTSDPFPDTNIGTG